MDLDQDFVSVHCKDSKTKKSVYDNVHAAITIKKSVREKLEKTTNETNPISVLFIGIDSISRMNFIRSLPLTNQYLQKHNWISLEGYNKIGDNTFPNLVGILTGYNESRAYSLCNPKKLNKLDECPFIWYRYRDLGYVTGYAEDEGWISTYNYKKVGFTKPPTDYYFRPYILGSEKLKMVKHDQMNYCTGPESAGERILNLAKDFVTTFKDYPKFGFFWMNTFSHNEVNAPSGMDKKVKSFFENIQSSHVLQNTIVIFLSDHGMRFGDIRYTATGWLEERLPFIYFWIPEQFKERFPTEVKNFQINTKRLTTPYDLHMTLQHILVLSGFNHTIKPSDACSECRSLFEKIPYERSCEDAAIEQHWCTCAGYVPIDHKNSTVQEASRYILGEIEKIIREKHGDSICAKFSVHRIMAASVSDSFTYKSATYFLIMMETKPKAIFEATVLYDNSANEVFTLQGSISRLDSYAYHSKCADDSNLKKYCHCRW